MNTGFDIPNALLLLTTAIGVYILLRERRSSRSRLRDREEWVKSYLKQNTHEDPGLRLRLHPGLYAAARIRGLGKALLKHALSARFTFDFIDQPFHFSETEISPPLS